ncbi:phosphoribosylglycinamide formyltransferase [bacterium]|nr:phosphoribosylglycinamide formyltransferase [bacterium]
MRVVVLISGRGSNLGALLRAMERGRLAPAKIVGVGSDKESAAGLERARQAEIDTQVFPRDWVRGLEGFLDRLRPDLVCLAGFMRILPPSIIEKMEGRILNIHPSLLPAFPGLQVHQRVLDAGMEISGCTVHWVDEGVDTGSVVGQIMVAVKEEDTAQSLGARVLEAEHRLYPRIVQTIASEFKGEKNE